VTNQWGPDHGEEGVKNQESNIKEEIELELKVKESEGEEAQ
jgi:hypothetical protein